MSLRTRVGNVPRPARQESAPPASLRSRPAGYAAMEACLAERSATSRNRLERLIGISPLRRGTAELYELATLEEETAAGLAQLPADWTVLHSVPLSATVVPHLALGPAGVFAIFPQPPRGAAAEFAAGDLLIDGGVSPIVEPVRRAARETDAQLGAALPFGVRVVPVIAFVAPRRLTLRSAPADISVVEAEKLTPWLKSLPEICSALQVDRMADAAEDPATWSDAGVGAGETLRHAARFARLGAELEAADRRWRLTVRILVVAGLAVTVLSGLMVASLLGVFGS